MPSFFFHITVDLKSCASNSKTLDGKDIFKHHLLELLRQKEPLSSLHSHVDDATESLVAETFHDTKQKPNGLDELSTDKSYDSFDDWRFGKVSLQHIDMLGTNKGGTTHKQNPELMHLSHGIGAGPNELAIKGRYEPSEIEDEELGWGIVRLYRDVEDTPGLYEDPLPTRTSKHSKSKAQALGKDHHEPFRDEDCTTLCILAVPSYLTPSDFLGFVGEQTREEVSHFRMIRTERSNRYMVLMKFRNGRKAREWRKKWNGKVFNSMEVSLPPTFAPSTCRNVANLTPPVRKLPCRLREIH